MRLVGHHDAGCGVRQDERLFRRCEPVVQRNKNRTDARQREQQHQHRRVVQSKVGDAVSRGNAQRLQGRRGPHDALPQGRVADVFTLEMQCHLARRKPGMPLYDAGEIHRHQTG